MSSSPNQHNEINYINNNSSPNSSSSPLSSSINFINSQYENHHHSNITLAKSFVCEICNKAFRFRSNLAEHRSVHTAVKPFVCKFCGKSSRLKGNLTKHILKHHKNEQRDYIGTDDYIIKKGKKSVKDPAAIEFLERSMIVLNNSLGANNNRQSCKETISKESSVENNDNNNSIIELNNSKTDNLLQSLGFDNNSFEIKEEENNINYEQPLASSSPLTPENENKEEQNVMSVVALMAAAAAASSSSCPIYTVENNNEEQQDEEMENDEEEHQNEEKIEDFINKSITNNLGNYTQKQNYKNNYKHQNNNRGDITTTINNTSAASATYKALLEQFDAKIFAKALFGGNETYYSPNEQLIRLLTQLNETTPATTDSSNLQSQNNNIKNKTEETIIPASTNSFLATKCRHCGKNFRKSRDLLSHLASAHKLPLKNNGYPDNNSAASFVNSAMATTNRQSIIDSSSQQSSPSSVFSNSSLNIDHLKMTTNNLPEMLSIELKRLRKAIFNLKKEENDGGHQKHLLGNGGSLLRVEQILGQLDSRVCRLEKQLEMALNSIYTLVQLQTGINNNINKLSRFQSNNNSNNC